MGKRLLFLLVALLCVRGSVLKGGKNKSKVAWNRSEPAVVVPRTFLGELNPIHQLNGTLVPSRSPPVLRLLSNGTAEYLRGPLSTRVIPTFYLLLVAVGIPANVAILCALASKVRKASSAILYCSLAASDLLLLLSLLFKAHYHLRGNQWVLGEAACRVVTACFYGNLYCSALTLACIGVNRYLAVVHPFAYKGLPKRASAAWVSVAVWGAFGGAVVPELLVQQSYRLLEVDRVTCHDVLPLGRRSHGFLVYYNLFLAAFGLLAPLLVTAACYARIVRELNRSHHDWSMYVKASSLVFVIFVLCFAPAGVLHLLHHVQLLARGTEGLYVHFNVAACLCCLHACLDPFLFLLMSKSAASRRYSRTFKGKTLSLSV
ncbi:proteinase-activated receptor 3 [Gasterosteus aculeatus]